MVRQLTWLGESVTCPIIQASILGWCTRVVAPSKVPGSFSSRSWGYPEVARAGRLLTMVTAKSQLTGRALNVALRCKARGRRRSRRTPAVMRIVVPRLLLAPYRTRTRRVWAGVDGCGQLSKLPRWPAAKGLTAFVLHIPNDCAVWLMLAFRSTAHLPL